MQLRTHRASNELGKASGLVGGKDAEKDAQDNAGAWLEPRIRALCRSSAMLARTARIGYARAFHG